MFLWFVSISCVSSWFTKGCVSNTNTVQKEDKFSKTAILMFIYLHDIISYYDMYVIIYVYKYFLKSISYPALILRLTLLTICSQWRKGFQLGEVCEVMEISCARNCHGKLCLLWSPMLSKYKFTSPKNAQAKAKAIKSCLNMLKPFSSIFHHSSILERARVHKGINCGATSSQMQASFATNQWQLIKAFP